MKALLTILVSLMVSNAEASWMSVKCSNSDGTVNWVSGHDDNQINLKYSNFVEGTLTLDMDQVILKFDKEFTIQQKSVRTCTYAAHKRVYAGKVKITASDKHPDVLRSLFPENRIQTEVICTLLANNPLPCEEK